MKKFPSLWTTQDENFILQKTLIMKQNLASNWTLVTVLTSFGIFLKWESKIQLVYCFINRSFNRKLIIPHNLETLIERWNVDKIKICINGSKRSGKVTFKIQKDIPYTPCALYGKESRYLGFSILSVNAKYFSKPVFHKNSKRNHTLITHRTSRQQQQYHFPKVFRLEGKNVTWSETWSHPIQSLSATRWCITWSSLFWLVRSCHFPWKMRW